MSNEFGLPDWYGSAPCAGRTELFFSTLAKEKRSAIAICKTCPHVMECTDWATGNAQEYGIWGGISAPIGPENRATVDTSSLLN